MKQIYTCLPIIYGSHVSKKHNLTCKTRMSGLAGKPLPLP